MKHESDPGWVKHCSTVELEMGLDEIRQAPKVSGVLKMILRRPQSGERELLGTAELDVADGLIGDNWKTRSSTPNLRAQLTLMGTRAAQLVAQSRERWALAGDQIYADLDLSDGNLPAGTRLSVGSAILEVSEVPHLGCAKFVARFGADAMKFVNSPVGKALRLRGVNLQIIQSGRVEVGDLVTKL